MRHLVKGRKLKRTASHRKALLANMATSLFEHKKIVTTEAKAKTLRPFAEHLITKAKHALVRERQNLLPDGQTVDIHNRRIVARVIRRKAVLQELFDAIAPVVESRNGGYTRIVKLGVRRGDAGKKAMIELVDWAAPQDGPHSMKKRKKKKAAPIAAPANLEAPVAEIVEAPITEEVAPIAEVTETVETVEAVETVENTDAVVTEDAPAEAEPTSDESKKLTFDDTAEPAADNEENKA